MNGLNPIDFNNLNGLMEIYADNLNTLTINNLEIDQSLTLSANITANNAIITPTNISYCDATSSIQTQINNLSQQLYTTTGGVFMNYYLRQRYLHILEHIMDIILVQI